MTLFLLFSAPYRWPNRTLVRRVVARVTVHSYGSGPLWERVAGVADALQGVVAPRPRRVVPR
eukprot:4343790-Prymnesium_polylepis.1